jgi:DNA-binding NarL/FixJ family response regulator
MRQGLRALLDEQADFKVVGEAGDGKQALRLVQNLRPDVLVADMVMPGINGVELTRQVKWSTPETTIVILSMYGTEGYVHKAMRAGAKAYVLKDASGSELAEAIRKAVSGERYLSRKLSEHAIDTYIRDMMPESHDLDTSMVLTGREHEVLQRIARGDKNREIAADLSISPRTVEFHRANIMRKLGLASQQELFRYCVRAGILKAEG